MVIHVKSHLTGCNTNEEGDVLLELVRREIAKHGTSTVDFHGVLYVTTSFINSAFVPLLDDMTFDEVKSRLRILKAYPQITGMIKSRLTDESKLLAA